MTLLADVAGVIPPGYWLTFLGAIIVGFAVPEAQAIRNRQGGDTLSENVRRWLRTDTPGGGASWLAVWTALATVLVWLLGHILRWWS